MAITELGVANRGLQILGEPTISSLSEGTEGAKAMKTALPISRDSLLADHHWTFAMDRRILAQTTPGPAFGWEYKYALPVDCITPLSIDEHFHLKDLDYGAKYPFSPENGFLLTDHNEAYLTYIARVEDASKWTPLFAEALSAKLAMDVAFYLTGSQGNTDVANALYKAALKKARAQDARMVGVQRNIPGLNVRHD